MTAVGRIENPKNSKYSSPGLIHIWKHGDLQRKLRQCQQSTKIILFSSYDSTRTTIHRSFCVNSGQTTMAVTTLNLMKIQRFTLRVPLLLTIQLIEHKIRKLFFKYCSNTYSKICSK